jgi:hypothetical protein
VVVLKMLPFDNKSSSRWWSTCPPARRWSDTAAVLHELGAHLATQPEVLTAGLRRHRRADQLQRPGAPVLPARRRRVGRPAGQPGGQAPPQRQSHAIAQRLRPALQPSARAMAPTSRWWKCRPARRCCRRSWPRSTAPTKPAASIARGRARARRPFERTDDIVDIDTARERRAPRACCVCATGARPRCWACPAAAIARHAARRPVRRGRHLPARRPEQVPGAGAPAAAGARPGDLDALLALPCARAGQAGAAVGTGARERHA